MRISTTHHDDFRAVIAKSFGNACVILFGTRPHPRQNEFVAYATDWEDLVIFTTDAGQPEGWSDGIALGDIDALKWVSPSSARRVRTTHYEDFRTIVAQMFAGGCVVFFGTRPAPRHQQFLAYATNWQQRLAEFSGNSGQPETFPQNFGNPAAVALQDIDELRWEL
jgi:hypothetical protein